MANVVWHEARGEPLQGKRAVLEVVINRAKAEKSGICSVVFRKGQFSWAKPFWGKPTLRAYSNNHGLLRLTKKKALCYASAMLTQPSLNDSSYVYFSRGYQYGSGCVRIGGHLFCRGEL